MYISTHALEVSFQHDLQVLDKFLVSCYLQVLSPLEFGSIYLALTHHRICILITSLPLFTVTCEKKKE